MADASRHDGMLIRRGGILLPYVSLFFLEGGGTPPLRQFADAEFAKLDR